MYFEISNPMDYHVALYIRLSKEDENEGPSESVNNQRSLLQEFVDNDFALIHYDRAVCQQRFFHKVRDQNDGHSLFFIQAGHNVDYLPSAAGIKHSGRFV